MSHYNRQARLCSYCDDLSRAVIWYAMWYVMWSDMPCVRAVTIFKTIFLQYLSMGERSFCNLWTNYYIVFDIGISCDVSCDLESWCDINCNNIVVFLLFLIYLLTLSWISHDLCVNLTFPFFIYVLTLCKNYHLKTSTKCN